MIQRLGTSLEFPGKAHQGAEAPEFQSLVRRQLELLGEDPTRDGLRNTPERVATSLGWLTRGYSLDVAQVVGDAVFDESHENMVELQHDHERPAWPVPRVSDDPR